MTGRFFLVILPMFIALSNFSCTDREDSNRSGSNKSVTLIWEAPTTNANGMSLKELGGYKIYYGTSSHNYVVSKNIGSTSCQNIANKTQCTYTVEDLSPDTYYFAVTAYDTKGNESGYSNEVNKKIE